MKMKKRVAKRSASCSMCCGLESGFARCSLSCDIGKFESESLNKIFCKRVFIDLEQQ